MGSSVTFDMSAAGVHRMLRVLRPLISLAYCVGFHYSGLYLSEAPPHHSFILEPKRDISARNKA